MTDAHGADVLALLDHLVTQERECGRLRAQLEFHLRLRTVAEAPVAERPDPVSSAVRGRKYGRGELERTILSELTQCDALKTRELVALTGSDAESIRQCLQRLIRHAKVQRVARGRYQVTSEGPG